MPWRNPLPGAIKGPDEGVLRKVFNSLREWTQREESRIVASGTAPANPVVNDIWIKTSAVTAVKYWDGTAWQTVAL